MGLAVGLTLVGRLTDTFGRRWFFITGTALGCIGAIIASTATSINVLIGGQVLVGLSASTGYSYGFVIGELVPVKRRFIFNSLVFIFSFPTAGFGAAVSTAFILKTGAGWRWAYYLLIIINGLTTLFYAVFYFPPTFHQKHGKDHVAKFLRTFDWVGLFLYTAGLVLFILGLSSGDTLYPWVDARVLAPLIIGFLCLVALFVYEGYANLSQPLIPIYFFKNRGWVAAVMSLSLAASVYYSQAIVWPQMTVNVYAQGRVMWGGLVSSTPHLYQTIITKSHTGFLHRRYRHHLWRDSGRNRGKGTLRTCMFWGSKVTSSFFFQGVIRGKHIPANQSAASWSLEIPVHLRHYTWNTFSRPSGFVRSYHTE